MTLDEAIYKLERQLDGNPALHDPEVRQAMHLGIEALKRLSDNRRDPEFDHYILLPGETEE